MQNKRWAVLAVAAGLAMIAGPIFAHHGVGPFDTRRSTTVKGTITKFDFIQPHVQMYFDVKNDNGAVEKWSAESASPNMMHRAGWDRNTLKPGDQITATGNPAKDGSTSMRLTKLVMASGQEFIPWLN
ncbi:MAG: hypothetical protein A3J28_09630 [Acidobacteria bacterium RIFCSPLOWO2_12_FULL_60_22]|nr:MAG: hypothetical protein A3J28_09630 [Acidobacteria bacterium RIFCSPLOWO2_12_FULL_60_22]